MKNLTYLVALMFALTTVFTSCEKEDGGDEPEVPAGITVADLAGDWYFVSLEFNGNTTYDCDAELDAEYDLITLNIFDVTASTLTITQECNNRELDMNYSFANNTISTEGGRKFQIMNVNEFLQNKDVLKLKLIASDQSTEPEGGIYTLEK